MKRMVFLLIIAIATICSGEASAFWGNETGDAVSGLDVKSGFDVNTVTSFTGTIMSPPERKADQEHTLMTMATTRDTVTVVLGPWWYWERQGFSISKNQEITVTGSRAQGKDGVIYMFAQRLEIRSGGETLMLRSESGAPLWSEAGAGNRAGMRQNGANSPRNGSGSRGSGFRGGRR